MNGRWEATVAAGLFIFTGLVITSERERLLMGVRCENWFHYGMGIAVLLFTQALR